MKRICVLGATGSIGTQALDVIEKSNGEFAAECICAGKNAQSLAKLANKFMPKYVGISDENAALKLKELLLYPTTIIAGEDAPQICAKLESADVVINGISGMAGFLPLVCAIRAGKIIAAANKESIIYAHSILDSLKEKKDDPLVVPFSNGARIIPVDSEQSAIFQCLESSDNIESLILTASGGAFWKLTKEQLDCVTPSQALCHPNWSMGSKITIDSASLFNKGLEIMEAAYLFGFSGDKIEVLIHPQSIVHSAVRFADGSIKAQLSVPDMRGAIQYAITYPKRIKSPVARLNLTQKPLEFYNVDNEKYPAINLAYEALSESNALPIAYNAANEVAVKKFMCGKCKFTDIAKTVAYAMKKTDTHVNFASVSDILETDKAARCFANEYISI